MTEFTASKNTVHKLLNQKNRASSALKTHMR